MADWDTNIYYNPEKHGLTPMGEIDTGRGYDFTKLVVWRRDEDGVIFWSTDSGCSCPSPFEDANSVNDLKRIDDAATFSREARTWLREQYDVSADDRDAMERLIRKVQRAARKAAAA
ncbi:hypothetical protein ACF1DV_25860 [Streptomyces achromogenes]|uniref:DUF7574 domain-containing protein n=1 Tax=Streptomyces achromogenes TaxID=67255 RepID=UPI0036F98374